MLSKIQQPKIATYNFYEKFYNINSYARAISYIFSFSVINGNFNSTFVCVSTGRSGMRFMSSISLHCNLCISLLLLINNMQLQIVFVQSTVVSSIFFCFLRYRLLNLIIIIFCHIYKHFVI